MSCRLAAEPYSLSLTKALVFVVTFVLKVFNCNIITENISIHDFAVILLW